VPPNGSRISRRERAKRAERVGWMRRLARFHHKLEINKPKRFLLTY